MKDSVAIDNKCPSCGANIKFNPTTQKWDCEYCGASYDVDTFKKEETVASSKHLDEYTCKNCGAVIVTDENTAATSCVYCGNTSIMKDRLQGEFKPDKLIPFKKVKEDAVAAFQKEVSKKWFAPKEFSKKENIEKISGVYIPFWLFDGEAEGNIKGNAQKVRTWTQGDYEYTETETYLIERSGMEKFEDVPTDASSKFPDELMDAIEPFNYADFKPFEKAYLSGFLAEKYDKTSEDEYPRAENRMKTTLKSDLESNIVGYSSYSIMNSNIEVNKGNIEYALLPVWMLNIKFQEKLYTFAMNGQTGKCIGDVPVDKKQVVKKSLLFFSICEIFLFLIFYLIGGGI